MQRQLLHQKKSKKEHSTKYKQCQRNYGEHEEYTPIYAEGLHTVMHYPQHFIVTLRGEPAVRNDFTTAPCMISGHNSPAMAVNSVLRFTMDPQAS